MGLVGWLVGLVIGVVSQAAGVEEWYSDVDIRLARKMWGRVSRELMRCRDGVVW